MPEREPSIAEIKVQLELFKCSSIIYSMRLPLFVLMIALLLVRGWAGDAMATDMALAPLQHATILIATSDHKLRGQADSDHESAASRTTHDCGGHADEESEDARLAADAHCESCAACQACHSVALTPATPGGGSLFSSIPQPRSAAAQFASAETARGQKPPIS